MYCLRLTKHEPVPLCGTIELAFLDNPLMRLGRTFNPILKVVAFGWQKLRDLIDATAGAEGPGRATHRLTNFEFMAAHDALHIESA